VLKAVEDKIAVDWVCDMALSLPVFVLAYDEKLNRPSGMIAGWNMPCSSDGLRICVALWEKGYTHKLVQQTKEFMVAVPNEDLLNAVTIFGKKHGDKVAKFDLTGIKTQKAMYLRTPLLTEATANYECRVEHEYKSGDHFLFVGKVLVAYVNTDKKILVNTGTMGRKRSYIQL
jgi:flavin reductase (DIM6/NTAB) family NADH-FMN oxidoreductase RutF